ncbi:methylated-DNA--[protein]-cysteine S-methyltransferase [Cognatilysobacter bugurensis]|uniref:Methylated-DNA--protein-cysteine methyltransferase n=1 Tax=Cognatilysobacter bugurensis TaxID=543356 RepID=A0A918SRL0_9GAMM|nr:methylated-DNA--[protein]-cysteine S-methyltransferase [Lysobacter bugurensis]GHA68383.1 methylated-DNA--protein-cysteine methyltransferase [Lysobacter bugurensis]
MRVDSTATAQTARAPIAPRGRAKSSSGPASSATTWSSTFDTPVGPLLIGACDDGICLIEFHESKHRVARGPEWRDGEHPLLDRLRTQLHEYFAGTRRVFDLPLAPRGTPFQREVWHALASIPYGQTVSYAQLASRVGRPAATRAVGAANGRNPLPIVLPCHRVIGANGRLTGFGGGLPTKHYLLQLEGAPCTDALFA